MCVHAHQFANEFICNKTKLRYPDDGNWRICNGALDLVEEIMLHDNTFLVTMVEDRCYFKTVHTSFIKPFKKFCKFHILGR